MVELEKVEAARRQLCQVLDTESPPDSVTSLSITGLEDHSWPIPDLTRVCVPRSRRVQRRVGSRRG